jgi:hypothetical protein
MSQFTPQETFSIASSLFAGLFMLKLGLRKKSIRWRIPSRCPSCGRARALDGRCDNCVA